MFSLIKKISPFRTYFWMYRYALAGLFLLIILGMATEGLGIGLLFPFAEYVQKGQAAFENTHFKYLLTVFSYFGLVPSVTLLILTIFLCILLNALIGIGIALLSAYSYYGIGAKISDDVVQKVIHGRLEYIRKLNSGKFINLVYTEANSITASLKSFFILAVNALSIFVCLLFSFFISWKLTLLVIFISVIKYSTASLFLKKAAALGRGQTLIANRLNRVLVGIYQGIEVIKTFASEKNELLKFREENMSRFSNLKQSVLNRQGMIFLDKVIGYGLLCLIVYLAISFFQLAGSSVIIFLFLIHRVIPYFSEFNSQRNAIFRNMGSLVYLPEIVTQGLPSVVWGNAPLKSFKHEITFKDVSFCYPGTQKKCLQNINFTVHKNDKVAVVGPSGVGKTTLMRLMLRHYDPTEGKILVDGLHLQSLRQHDWIKTVSFISQDVFIFDASVKENIIYGVENISEKEFEKALNQSGADEFVAALPQKELTMIGERGVKLSGGQRQRIALARAFLRNSPIILLDEATSSLDAASEKHIQRSLNLLSENRTMIVIAHRLSTIRDVDRIIVLEEGKVANIGKHEELLAEGGLYKKFHELQLQ